MPQNLKTEGDGLDASDLPDLTPQQLQFVEHVLAGKTASDAYRASYDTSNMMTKTVWAEASRLRAHPDVAAWLAAARMANLGNATVTLEGHTREMERLREIALAKGNVGAAVLAEHHRGKANGLYVDKVQAVAADADDPHRTLDAIAKEQGADKAMQLASIAGITSWKPSDATRH